MKQGLQEPHNAVTLRLTVQYVCGSDHLPKRQTIRRWVLAALSDRCPSAVVTVRIVGEIEGAELNQRWRKRRGATNVLSFPSLGLEQIAPGSLGDIVICAPIVLREARAQKKPIEAHWAHLVVHGVLHLLGFDHKKNAQAKHMEQVETDILTSLGYPDPYRGAVDHAPRGTLLPRQNRGVVIRSGASVHKNLKV